jgi:glycosyltransferase involved in cell wall biosynthesis
VNIPKIGRVFTLYEYEEVKNKQNFVMIPQGINKIRTKTMKKWNDKITLTIFGFVRPTKDYSLAIRALSYLSSEYRLVIAGKVIDKSLAREIKNLIKKLRLENRVTLIPRFLSEKEKEKIFQKTSILLLPYHIISNSAVLLDGIKYEKPVVTTVLKEDIEKMGIGKFSSHTPKEFAEKILDCNKEYQKILNNIRRVQPRFLWKNVTKKIVKAFMNLIS